MGEDEIPVDYKPRREGPSPAQLHAQARAARALLNDVKPSRIRCGVCREDFIRAWTLGGETIIEVRFGQRPGSATLEMHRQAGERIARANWFEAQSLTGLMVERARVAYSCRCGGGRSLSPEEVAALLVGTSQGDTIKS